MARQITLQNAAKKVVKAILEEGLGGSTWKDNHPAAYAELLEFRADMEQQFCAELSGWEIYE